MMGFEGGVCAVTNARFGQGKFGSPIWMSNVLCSRDDECLGNCSFIGLDRPITFCGHNEDAGVVCLSGLFCCVIITIMSDHGTFL